MLCRSSPLKAEKTHLLRKVIPRVENRQGKEAFVQVRFRPEDTQGVRKRNIRIFDYFFVYARQGEWRLLGRGDILDAFEPRLLGWARKDELIRWDTRNVAKPRPQARFFANPGDKEPIAQSTAGKWGKSVRRPPITDEKTIAGQRYLRVVLPVDFASHRRHSENLRSLARAEGAWRQPNIVFLVDGTHSTGPYLKEIHALLHTLLDELEQEGRGRKLTFRYSLYAYTDAAYGPGYHTRRYLGATENIWSVRRAFKSLEEDTRKTLTHSIRDDYPEDIYVGIRRVREEVLTDATLTQTLPVLIVIGDHGGHERNVSRSAIGPLLEDIVPYFIQMGRQDRQESPNCQNHGKLRQREQRFCAFQRFEEDAEYFLGARFEKNFFRGEDPKVLADQVQSVLKEVLHQQARTPLVVDSLATGQPWEDAKRVSGWPLAYTQAFHRLLLAQGYDKTVLERGDFVAVREAWVLEKDIVPEVFITKPDLYRWIGLFERMARAEHWDGERVPEIFASSIGVYVKEGNLWRRPLAEVLKKRAGVPFRNTGLLQITLDDLTNLEREEIRHYGLLFGRLREALERIAQGRLSKIEIGYHGGSDRKLPILGKSVPADIWFEFAGGTEAAYLELRHLP
uniref:VWFA domain-containing protein n=1 Tax=Candidatus Kentrum sp. MB TaxID=2138164 RepID=A0A450Y0I2_9GAMM|nr:MAG: hypothetical protein BECKMB1821I_GA0114274_10972 [Candidatus Kentron sp. MB]VFK77261.1 MAG: hypothetical protein BECKMB1821H_GA0114242_11162 [Candidatus Kentron sp. MB]